jgi:type IX secretion system PorP/SprF family membrane protein
MKKHKNLLSGLAISLLSFSFQAQQLPMYTHYMNNTLVINPGYAGSREALTVTALHRSQWINFKGAPMTQTLTLHTPIVNKHLGIGLSASNDRIGPVNNTTLGLSLAYIMTLTKKSKLAIGLSGGFNMMQANLSTLLLDEQNDPVFVNDVNNKFTPSVGFGAYYSRERFYAGVSSPNVLENNYSKITLADGTTLTGKEARHYFFIAGALFNLNRKLAFKPTTLVKVTGAAPVEVDATLSFIIAKKLLLGAMYRSGDALGALIGFNISEQLHIGYSFDWSYGIKTFRYNNGSHELMLRYDFIFSGKKQIHSPRYF